MPSSHYTFTHCWLNVGPALQTVAKIDPTLGRCLLFTGLGVESMIGMFVAEK